MTKSTVIDFARPSDFSPDPLTDLLRAGAQELLATAVRAEVTEFMKVNRPLFAGGWLLHVMRPYLMYITLHSTSLLLLLAGYIRWAQAGGGY